MGIRCLQERRSEGIGRDERREQSVLSSGRFQVATTAHSEALFTLSVSTHDSEGPHRSFPSQRLPRQTMKRETRTVTTWTVIIQSRCE
eukprot:2046800-Rhodomonas_salina.1